jgi:hypothetical protein
MTSRFIPGDTVQVPEIPFADEIRLPTARTAVVVVDMQNDPASRARLSQWCS